MSENMTPAEAVEAVLELKIKPGGVLLLRTAIPATDEYMAELNRGLNKSRAPVAMIINLRTGEDLSVLTDEDLANAGLFRKPKNKPPVPPPGVPEPKNELIHEGAQFGFTHKFNVNFDLIDGLLTLAIAAVIIYGVWHWIFQ